LSQPEDADADELNFSDHQHSPTPLEPNTEVPPIQEFDAGFDFNRMTSEWFQRVDDRRENFPFDLEVDEEGNDNVGDVVGESFDPETGMVEPLPSTFV